MNALETALRKVLDVADVTDGPVDPTKIHDAIGHELVYLLMTYDRLPRVESATRGEIFTDVALLLRDRARMWHEDNRPVLAQECEGLAFAYEQYASGNGLPPMETQREKIRHLSALLEAARARADRVTREKESLRVLLSSEETEASRLRGVIEGMHRERVAKRYGKEPKKAGWYVYTEGRNLVMFLRQKNGQWRMTWDDGNCYECNWKYIEQALSKTNKLELVRQFGQPT